MRIIDYKRNLAISYAYLWALGRNPKYYNYDLVGGDCTSFVSQCLYVDSEKMNYNKTNGIFVAAHTYEVLRKKISEYDF